MKIKSYCKSKSIKKPSYHFVEQESEQDFYKDFKKKKVKKFKGK